MTTTRFPSKTGLGIAVLHLVLGALTLYGSGWLLVKLGPQSLSAPAIVRISLTVSAVVLVGLLVAIVRRGGDR